MSRAVTRRGIPPQNSTTGRDTKMKFQKGVSGNPGGRPKVVGHVQELARTYTTEAIEALVGVMRDLAAPPAARVTASTAILDRGYGRPAQTIDANLQRKNIDELTDAELIAIAAGADEEEEAPARRERIN